MARNPFPMQRVFGGQPLSADFLNGLAERLDYLIALMPEKEEEDDRPGTEEVRGAAATDRDGEVPNLRA